MNLYPLKFKPQLYAKIWGGKKLHELLHKENVENAGESWEISGVEGHCSVVSNGYLAENTLEELIEIYMGELVGDQVYEKFGLSFPLLIKFIDANDDLSIQVHPNDEMAAEKHNSYGKTEMWYIMQADKKGKLNCGFNTPMNRQLLEEKIANGSLSEALNFIPVQQGDCFFIPAGTVHAIGKGLLVAEIQQTSDITYRLFDYNRKDKEGNLRDLHVKDAAEAIDFNSENPKNVGGNKELESNKSSELVKCPYFTTNVLHLTQGIQKDIYGLDSFVIYLCVDGEAVVMHENNKELLKTGECILIPASCHQFSLIPETKNCKLLEVHL
ncbi:MAG: type I phosphomannose isomerase catalytic subunit [Mangrovibacterium sp.]